MKHSLITAASREPSEKWMCAGAILPVCLVFFMMVSACKPSGDPAFTVNKSEQHRRIEHVYDSLFEQGNALLYNYPDSARIMALDGLERAKDKGNTEWEVRFMNLAAVSHSVLSDFESALPFYHQVMSLAVEMGDKDLAGAVANNLGNVFKHIGSHKEALSYFLMSRQYYDKTGNLESRAKVDNNISTIYGEIGNMEKAMTHCRHAYKEFTAIGDSIGMDTSLNNLGTLFFKTGELDSAHYYYDKAISMQIRSQNTYNLCVSYKGKADVFYGQGDYEQAIDYYQQSEELSEKIGFLYQQIEAQLGMAEVYLALEDLAMAENHVTRALGTAGQINAINLEKEAHRVLSKIYENRGDQAKSLSHYHTYHKLEKELMDQTKIHQVYNLEIEELIQDSEIQQLEIERQRLLLSRRAFLTWLIALASVFTLSITLFMYYVYINKIRQKQKNELNEARLRLAEERSQAALEAEVSERKRLGFELHDGVGPLLSLAKLNVTALKKKSELQNHRLQPILQNTVDTIHEILKEIKQISHNMAPIALKEKGLAEAVRDMLDKIKHSGGYKTTFEAIGFNRPLDSYTEHTLYRSIQEVLNNVITHAEATEIQLQLIRNDEDLTVMVEDNGRGFQPESLKANKGMGLKSASSRIKGMGGEFLIDSAKGRGTIITMIIPCTQAPK
jgi:two-component system, NarL family, sensor kinase